MRISIGVVCFLVSPLVIWGQAGPASHNSGVEASAKPPVIVIGFVGGFVSGDNSVHSGVQLAARLRKDYPSGVYVKVFGNHYREQAHADVLRLLDAKHDGKPSDEEKQHARIIIYGHSWGGSETIELARELKADRIPVLLTIQVDSVTKFGENDALVPSNVAEAVNFYQPEGMIHGRSQIYAEDSSRTQIIGNYAMNYKAKPVACVGYSWFATAFERSHIEIECDPNIMDRIESLIRSKLPAETKTSIASQ